MRLVLQNTRCGHLAAYLAILAAKETIFFAPPSPQGPLRQWIELTLDNRTGALLRGQATLTLYADLERIDICNELHKEPSADKEQINYAFPSTCRGGATAWKRPGPASCRATSLMVVSSAPAPDGPSTSSAILWRSITMSSSFAYSHGGCEDIAARLV